MTRCFEPAADSIFFGPAPADRLARPEEIGVHSAAASDFPAKREFDRALTPNHAVSADSSACLHLAVAGLSPGELEVLKSILLVLEERTARPWRLIGEGRADLYLHTRAAGVEVRESELVGLIVREGEPPASSDAIALHAPFRVMSVLDALNDANDRLVQRRHPSVDSEASLSHPADDGKALAAALARLVERRFEQNLRVRIVGFGALYLCPSARVYCVDFAHDRLCAALEEHRFVMTTLAQGSPELATQLTHSRPIDEVLWRIGLLTAWERTDLGTLRFRLRRWPDLARLPHRPDHIQMCATLAARPVTRAHLIESTGLGSGEVTHFLHACELCGLTQVEVDTAEPAVRTAPATPANGLGGLFDRLRRHLGF
jgi:hypothetical protein